MEKEKEQKTILGVKVFWDSGTVFLKLGMFHRSRDLNQLVVL